MPQSAAQLVLLASAQFPCARYVDWLQVQGFLDMAESALRAKNAANDVGSTTAKCLPSFNSKPVT